jgi:hypothetical protein
VHFVRRHAPSASVLFGTPIPFDSGLHPLLSLVWLNLRLFAAGQRPPQTEISIHHVGGLNPGELSHSLM